jgi:hypothetical protein
MMRHLYRVARAVLLGVGTIYGLKGDGDAHWSEPPNHVLSIEAASEHEAQRDSER